MSSLVSDEEGILQDVPIAGTGVTQDNRHISPSSCTDGRYIGLLNLLNDDGPLTLIPEESALQVSVSNPEKHGEGFKDAFVTYETVTIYPMDGEKFRVRRRYQDFLWLFEKLVKNTDYSGLILPPLPDKNRLSIFLIMSFYWLILDFMDRFSPEFVAKRQIGLERFLRRLVRHPKLCHDDAIRSFLSQPLLCVDSAPAPDRNSLNSYATSRLSRVETSSGMAAVVEQFTDAVGTVFGKARTVDEKFLTIKKNVSSLENHFEKISTFYGRFNAAVKALSHEIITSAGNFEKLSSCFGQLERLFIQEDHPAKPLKTLFGDFGLLLDGRSGIVSHFAGEIEFKLQAPMIELASYCKSAKHALKLRDQRQYEFQNAEDSLASAREELNTIAGCEPSIPDQSTTNSQGNLTSTRLGKSTVLNFLTEKMDSFRGVDPISARADRIKRLEARIEESKHVLEDLRNINTITDQNITHDVPVFTSLMTFEIRRIFIPNVCTVWTAFLSNDLDLWKAFVRETLILK